jgi:protein-disulfide isomerase
VLARWGVSRLGSAPANGAAGWVDAVSDQDWGKGNRLAAVTLIEYSDFQCPACAAYYPLVSRLSDEFPDQLHLVYRYYPLMQIHQNALASAKAAEAAGRQGKFWEMHDLLFQKQKDWSELSDPTDTFVGYARELVLDEAQWQSDLKNSDVEKVVLAQAEQGNRDGVNATPTFFLNGQKIDNPQSYDEFKRVVEALLPNASLATSTVSSSPAYSTKSANP